MIYLDYNATTGVDEHVAQSISDRLKNLPLNPSSQHYYGRLAYDIIEESRELILKNIFKTRYNEYDLIFTSSGTESNNIIINSFAERVAVSEIEHASILKPTIEFGGNLIKVDENGIIDTNDIIYTDSLISCMHANNETGVINDIKKIAEISHKKNSFFHSDISQSFCKIDYNYDDSNLDFATISSHKIYAPIGCGALIYKKELKKIIRPLMFGGGQESFLRPSTHNVSAIYGMAVASDIGIKRIKKWSDIELLRDKLNNYIKSIGGFIASEQAPRLPNTSMFSVGIKKSILLMKMDINGIMISSGSACSSGRDSASHVLVAMGYSPENADTFVRLSMGINTKESEIECVIDLLSCITG
jgi:cysteine desulfurase